ncbi:sigma-E factor negative regulatory protein [Tepidimonas taiwanensis]|uniref:sigma-E factor negative regulatory protein n=1 Tax=Tepidimonas taiwanensis TaxID=307486 RepID=UPI000689901B|nr:sigma-E factor negative regulatory protein [Tepidimonas taiwanensis]
MKPSDVTIRDTGDERRACGERLSALFDGECGGDEIAAALAASDPETQRRTWDAYRRIGDALRAQAGGDEAADPAFVRAVMARVAAQPLPTVADAADAVSAPAALPRAAAAANDAVFRWRLVAGVAAVAAVVSILWQSGAVPGSAPGEVAQVAQTPAPPAVVVGATAGVVSAAVPVARVRDPQLEELMAAHRQWGGASALQTSAGFLRAASYDVPAR